MNIEQAQRLREVWATDRFRFVISGPRGRFSAAWAVWFHNDSLYLAGRTLGRMMKVSLHPEGGYRLAYEKPFIDRMKARGQPVESRDIWVWRPPQVVTGESVTVVSLLFPAANLHGEPRVGEPGKPLLELVVTSEDRAAQLDVLLTREQPEQLLPRLNQSGWAVHAWDKSDDSSFVLWFRETDYEPSLFPPRHQDIPAPVPEEFIRANEGKSLTMLIQNRPESGQPLRLAELGGIFVRRKT